MSDQQGWGPTTAVTVVLWIAAVLAAGWFLLLPGADPSARLIAGCAAVGLGVGAVFCTRARPRLRADAHGLTVRGLLPTRHHPWPHVGRVRVQRTRRLGRESSLLEIDVATADGDERLIVFGRFDLGTEPEDVAPVLLDLHPHRP